MPISCVQRSELELKDSELTFLFCSRPLNTTQRQRINPNLHWEAGVNSAKRRSILCKYSRQLVDVNGQTLPDIK